MERTDQQAFCFIFISTSNTHTYPVPAVKNIHRGKFRHFYDKSIPTNYNKNEHGENTRKGIVFFNLVFICYYIIKCVNLKA